MSFAHPSLTVAEETDVGDPPAYCERAGDDDTVRAYLPEWRAGFERAYHQLFPQSRIPPSEDFLHTGLYRCMHHHVMVCFIGANQPCGKLNQNTDNPGASVYCQSVLDAPFVPLYAIGHDSLYEYRCVRGQAIAGKTTHTLDSRGFDADLWVEVP